MLHNIDEDETVISEDEKPDEDEEFEQYSEISFKMELMLDYGSTIGRGWTGKFMQEWKKNANTFILRKICYFAMAYVLGGKDFKNEFLKWKILKSKI